MIELTGVIPPATTPFGSNDEIDYKLVHDQINWLIGA